MLRAWSKRAAIRSKPSKTATRSLRCCLPDRGGYAEFVALKATDAAPMPRTLNFTMAASVPLAAMTAWQGLFDHGKLRAGERVLIHGGAGGVGHFAIQFAKARNCKVCTTVSNRDIAFVRGIGADEVIDYQAERFENRALNIDLVLDLVGGETQKRSFSVLKYGGPSGLDPDGARQDALRQAGYSRYPLHDGP